jgi:hypothetical protein
VRDFAAYPEPHFLGGWRGIELSVGTFASMLLEELHLAFVLPRLLKRGKRPQIAPLARRFTLLSRVQTIFAGFEFADHLHMDAEHRYVAAAVIA